MFYVILCIGNICNKQCRVPDNRGGYFGQSVQKFRIPSGNGDKPERTYDSRSDQFSLLDFFTVFEQNFGCGAHIPGRGDTPGNAVFVIAQHLRSDHSRIENTNIAGGKHCQVAMGVYQTRNQERTFAIKAGCILDRVGRFCINSFYPPVFNCYDPVGKSYPF